MARKKRPLICPDFDPCDEDKAVCAKDGDIIDARFMPISDTGGNLLERDESGLYVECCLPDYDHKEDSGLVLTTGTQGPEWKEPVGGENTDLFGDTITQDD